MNLKSKGYLPAKAAAAAPPVTSPPKQQEPIIQSTNNKDAPPPSRHKSGEVSEKTQLYQASMLTQKDTGPVGPVTPSICWSCKFFTGPTFFL